MSVQELPDETAPATTYEQDMEKYTKIDNLDEDNGDVQYVLVSFVSPEKVMNCSIRGLKVRHYRNRPAIFSDYAQAQKAAQELNEREKFFDIFVMSTGRWCAWDPAPDDRTKVESEKWADKDQQELMDNLERMNADKQKKDLAELNALVGKKKDMVQQSEVDYNQRKAESIKQGLAEKDNPDSKQSLNLNTSQNVKTTSNDTEEADTGFVKTKSHSNKNIKEQLRRKLEERRRSEQPKSESTTTQSSVANVASNQSQLEENINKAKAILEKLQNKSS